MKGAICSQSFTMRLTWIKEKMKNTFKLNIVLTAVLTSVGLTACGGGSDENSTVTVQPEQPSALTDCMWQDAPTSKKGIGGADSMNYAYPDSNVNYWSSEFVVPEGAKVTIDGDYPYSRHFSLVSYTAKGERVNSLLDANIHPGSGVTNPFIVGNKRLNKERAYSAELVLGDLPATPAANVLYAPKTEGNGVALIYRVYVPNENTTPKGGVEFPRFKVQLANGETKTGNEVCSVLNVKKKSLDNIFSMPIDLALSLYNKQPYLGFPAQQNPKWYTAYNGPANTRCIYKHNLEQCEGYETERKLNQWATPDNEYVFSVISRRLGKVVELKGKIPAIAPTSKNENILQAGDIRYWSVCSNELFTTATNFCLYDEQIKNVDKDGNFTIVASLPEDRPANATEECGVNYLRLSERGNGYNGADAVEKGHTDLGFLIMRNLLPYSNFNQAVQNTKIWGDEKSIMGDYLPEIKYTSKEDFEAKGCN